MLKHSLKSRQIPRGKSLDFLYELGNEMQEKGQLALTVDMDRLPKKDLSFLSGFQHLRRLTIRGGTQNQISKIIFLSNLNDLSLISCKVNDYEFLEDLRSLEILDIRLGGAKDYSHIGCINSLKAISFMKSMSLKDISFLANLVNLQYLRLDSCSNVEIIPDFSKLVKLKRVELDTLKRLRDICGISKSPSIKELIITSTKLSPKNFKCLINHKSLKYILPGIGSTTSKDSQEVNILLNKVLMLGSDYIGGKFEYFEIQ